MSFLFNLTRAIQKLHKILPPDERVDLVGTVCRVVRTQMCVYVCVSAFVHQMQYPSCGVVLFWRFNLVPKMDHIFHKRCCFGALHTQLHTRAHTHTHIHKHTHTRAHTHTHTHHCTFLYVCMLIDEPDTLTLICGVCTHSCSAVGRVQKIRVITFSS